MRVNYHELIDAAVDVLKNSYSPYSKLAIGAALLTDKGIIRGCNVENASYGLTCCAERVALFNAVSEGAKQFVAMAVAADVTNGPSPCGACRQALREFNPKMEIVISDLKGKYRVTDINELLPESFGQESLKQHEKHK